MTERSSTSVNEKIAILLPDLRGGGAERLHIYLANDWVERGYKVELILMQRHGELLSLVSPDVTIVDLGVHRIRQTIHPLKNYLRSSRPDVILSAMWPLTSASVIAWFLSRRHGKLYLIDHTMLSISCVKELRVPLLALKALMRATYPLATGIIAVSEGVKIDLCQLGNFSKKDIKVIYNPAATGVSPHRESQDVRKQLWGTGTSFNILTVGSLKEQKDHENLIRAFALLPGNLHVKLSIVGEGPLRAKLEKLIVQLGQESRISMPGFVKEPYPWFRSADLFVLSSRWEGLPLVLIEALECGVPIISTDCPSGPAEILDNGRYGKLIPVGDTAALVAAITASLAETCNRETLIKRAKTFSVTNISEHYLQYFFSEQN